MKNIDDLKIGIVGLGLMGGAFAISLRKNNKHLKIFAYDIDNKALELVKSKNIIDELFCDAGKMVPKCDIIFLCINPQDVLEFMDKWMESFSPGTIITDIGGCKRKIFEKMETTLRNDIDFIPGHPMAGNENSGFLHADKCNFNGKNYILVPLKRNKPDNLNLLKQLIYSIGFKRITETTAEDHDNKIAFTSQLCHVIASALIDCEPNTEITKFGGGSFEDLTRIAMLNVPMWTELFIENNDYLVERIKQFESSLDKLKILIAESNNKTLFDILGNVRNRRITMELK